MKNVEDYLRDFSFPNEHIREIIQRAQNDAYQDGYRAAAYHMLATAEHTMERVNKTVSQSLTNGNHG